jgi:hypothetical protein
LRSTLPPPADFSFAFFKSARIVPRRAVPSSVSKTEPNPLRLQKRFLTR